MKRSTGRALSCAALVLAIAAAACGDKGKGEGSASASATTKATTTTTASAATTEKAATSSSAATTAKAADSAKPVDPFADGDNSGEESGVLSVDLSAAKDDAPPLGGGAAPAPPPPPKGGKLEWLGAGSLAVPNPGWKASSKDGMGLLLPPDNKAFLMFTSFKAQQEGLKKVDAFTAQMKLKEMKWKKPKPVTIGPNKVPGLFGRGHGKLQDGKGAKMFYVLIKNSPENLLAMGGADDDGGESSLKVALNIIDNIKKK